MKRNYKIFGLFLVMAMLAYHTGNGQQLPQFSQYILMAYTSIRDMQDIKIRDIYKVLTEING
jgi:hypothetical protein